MLTSRPPPISRLASRARSRCTRERAATRAEFCSMPARIGTARTIRGEGRQCRCQAVRYAAHGELQIPALEDAREGHIKLGGRPARVAWGADTGRPVSL